MPRCGKPSLRWSVWGRSVVLALLLLGIWDGGGVHIAEATTQISTRGFYRALNAALREVVVTPAYEETYQRWGLLAQEAYVANGCESWEAEYTPREELTEPGDQLRAILTSGRIVAGMYYPYAPFAYGEVDVPAPGEPIREASGFDPDLLRLLARAMGTHYGVNITVDFVFVEWCSDPEGCAPGRPTILAEHLIQGRFDVAIGGINFATARDQVRAARPSRALPPGA